MKLAFFVSSLGDTNLAIETIKEIKSDQCEMLIVPLTEVAKKRIDESKIAAYCEINSVDLQIESKIFGNELSRSQVEAVKQYVAECKIDTAYIGVPSDNNHVPFQIAKLLNKTPTLIAYEFMFKPKENALWKHLEALKNSPYVQWAVPLSAAENDIHAADNINDGTMVHVIGHLSIDKAMAETAISAENKKTIREKLNIKSGESFALITSSTQPVHMDETLIEGICSALKDFPTMQVRLSLHPGIADLDFYIEKIAAVVKKYPDITNQFNIILPDKIIKKMKSLDGLNDPLFLKEELDSNQAASAADRVAQAVPGALLNQAALEGKPVYFPPENGKAYLPATLFSQNANAFFSASSSAASTKADLSLPSNSAPSLCLKTLLSLSLGSPCARC